MIAESYVQRLVASKQAQVKKDNRLEVAKLFCSCNRPIKALSLPGPNWDFEHVLSRYATNRMLTGKFKTNEIVVIGFENNRQFAGLATKNIDLLPSTVDPYLISADMESYFLARQHGMMTHIPKANCAWVDSCSSICAPFLEMLRNMHHAMSYSCAELPVAVTIRRGHEHLDYNLAKHPGATPDETRVNLVVEALSSWPLYTFKVADIITYSSSTKDKRGAAMMLILGKCKK